MKRIRLDEDNTDAAALPRHRSNLIYDVKRFPRQAKFLAERGATQADLADCFGVTTRTITNWRSQYPEFAQAIDAGNEAFDTRVERALAERAIGFYADNFKWRATTKEERAGGKPEFELVPTDRKYYPPDVRAISLWLRNRMPEKWSDVQKHIVQSRYQSSQEILAEIERELIEMKALPAPEE
jgi:hypothetical protein